MREALDFGLKYACLALIQPFFHARPCRRERTNAVRTSNALPGRALRDSGCCKFNAACFTVRVTAFGARDGHESSFFVHIDTREMRSLAKAEPG